jgi:hypothetical protein
MSSTCSICRDRDARATVNGLLARGARPSEIHAAHPSIASRSAMYRHARHAPRSPLTTRWVGASTSLAEAVGDLEDVRRALLLSFADAAERGADAAARGAAREIANLSAVLFKTGLDDADVREAITERERLVRTIYKATRNNVSVIEEIAAAARELNDDALAKEADDLRAAARTHHESKIEN